MHRFFLPELPGEHFKSFDGDLIHQIRRVFRAKIGDQFIFFSTGSSDCRYELESISHTEVKFLRKETLPLLATPVNHVTVFQAYPHKTDTLELIVQKLVELGVARLVLFRSERAQDSGIPPKKRLRITKIAQEALEQCGGNTPLEIIYSNNNISDLLSIHSEMIHFVGMPGNYDPEFPAVTSRKNIGLWIGPEGGWSETEEDIFLGNGIILWTFNSRILRLETASIVGAGLLLYLANKH